jgi:hypothetical protein
MRAYVVCSFLFKEHADLSGFLSFEEINVSVFIRPGYQPSSEPPSWRALGFFLSELSSPK